MKFLRQHWPLLVGVGLPVVFILIIFIVQYLPNMSARPTQDFVFSMEDYNGATYRYEVRGDKVQKQDMYMQQGIKIQPYEPEVLPKTKGPELYRYNVTKDESIPLKFEEVQKLSLDSSYTSKDGFSITYGHGSGGLLFGMFGGRNYDYNSRYISKGSVEYRLNLPKGNGYGSQFVFLGWVQ